MYKREDVHEGIVEYNILQMSGMLYVDASERCDLWHYFKTGLRGCKRGV